MLAIESRRRIRITNVSAGTVTRPSRAVVPATGVLRHIASERPLVAYLWRGCLLGCVGQNAESLLDYRVSYNLCQRSHRPNHEAVARSTHSPEFSDPAQINHYFGSLNAILQPVEAVESPSKHPGI